MILSLMYWIAEEVAGMLIRKKMEWLSNLELAPLSELVMVSTFGLYCMHISLVIYTITLFASTTNTGYLLDFNKDLH